jgi:hypothetical protein
MKKSLRTAVLVGTMVLTAAPGFCAVSGGNPRPQVSAWSSFVDAMYSVLGL